MDQKKIFLNIEVLSSSRGFCIWFVQILRKWKFNLSRKVKGNEKRLEPLTWKKVGEDELQRKRETKKNGYILSGTVDQDSIKLRNQLRKEKTTKKRRQKNEEPNKHDNRVKEYYGYKCKICLWNEFI